MKQALLITFSFLIIGCSTDTPVPTNPTAPSAGEVQLISIAAIEPTADTAVNGVVQLLAVQAGTRVKAEVNIVPEDNMYYQLWLTDENRSNPVAVGTLRSRTNDARHHTSFESLDDLTGYKVILVTKQTIGTDASLDQVVASGQFNTL